MADLADSLLLLAPQVDPPAGFETRLLDCAEQPPTPIHRRLRWRLVTAVAAAVVVFGGAGVAIGLGIGGTGLPPSVQAVGGQALSVVTLRAHGSEVGQAFLYTGRPSWLYMTVESRGLPDAVVCKVQTTNGKVVTVGRMTTSGSYRSWGSTLTVAPDQVQKVMLVDRHDNAVAIGRTA